MGGAMLRLTFSRLQVISLFSIFIIFSGCAMMRHPVPPDLVTKAIIGKMDDVRYMSGEQNTNLQKSLLLSIKQESLEDFPVGRDGGKVYPILAISGGGANGAYGAGLLKGWSKEGTRPLFKVITGVSTGAIIAVFAFLGKDYDAELERYYTTMSIEDVMTRKFPFISLLGDSLASNLPLERKISNTIDGKIIAKIAAEHRRGRRLFIGTANLDAERFVIWDMGAIACRGDVKLFRKVILASTAIPVIFPPTIFHVEVNGKTYDEMHVDGGALTQVFVTFKLVEGMESVEKELGIDFTKIKRKLFIIRNGYMSPTYKEVKDNIQSLANRSFEMIADTQGIGDAYRIYVFSKKEGIDYNLAFIPSDFKQNAKEMFDLRDMKRLFDRGYEDAVNGYKWHKAPPGVDEPLEMP
jgi:predicted acylesterase/phospholipase RssA